MIIDIIKEREGWGLRRYCEVRGRKGVGFKGMAPMAQVTKTVDLEYPLSPLFLYLNRLGEKGKGGRV